MKKMKSVVVIMFVAISLVACSSKGVSTDNTYVTNICKIKESGFISSYTLKSTDVNSKAEEVEVKFVLSPGFFIGDKEELNEEDRKAIEEKLRDEFELEDAELNVAFVEEGVRIIFTPNDELLKELVYGEEDGSLIVKDLMTQLSQAGHECNEEK